MRARLTIGKDEETPWVFDLTGPERVTLGRNQSNVIVLQDEHASRWHAEIYLEDDQWFIRDLGTRNGTQLDGERIDGRRALADGQEIGIGLTRLRFNLLSNGAAKEATPQKFRSPAFEPRAMPPDDLTALCSFMAAAASEADARALVRQALECAQAQTVATVVGFLSLDADHPLPKMTLPDSAHLDVHLSRRLTRAVQRDGRPCWLQPGSEDGSPEGDSLLLFTDALCVPVRGADTPLGALHAYKTGRHFTERDLHFCEALAAHLANCLSLLQAQRSLSAENRRLRTHSHDGDSIIGNSPAVEDLRRLIARAAPRPATVLIQGETGVGKELVALALHRQSPRAGQPLVVVNCAAIAPTLLESELFGYKKHAFTGAARDHPGLFQQADDGTLFLDEVGELSPECQAKLLRVLEGKAFRPVGASGEVCVDVRIVAATHRDLETEVREGRFREDLYFRIGIIPIRVPPLREHPEDIPALAEHFLAGLSRAHRRRLRLSDAALERLTGFHWPGNVRQLRSVLECSAALSDGELIDADDLRLSGDKGCDRPGTLNLEELEAWAIRQALKQSSGNITQAARALGVARDTLASRMKKFGIERATC